MCGGEVYREREMMISDRWRWLGMRLTYSSLIRCSTKLNERSVALSIYNLQP